MGCRISLLPLVTGARNSLRLQDLNYNSRSGRCCQGFCNATDTALAPPITAKLSKPLHVELLDKITGLRTSGGVCASLRGGQEHRGGSAALQPGEGKRRSYPLPCKQLLQQGHRVFSWGGARAEVNTDPPSSTEKRTD